MTKTLTESRYTRKYKIKSQTGISKLNPPNSLPSNLQKFKEYILSGIGFIVYQESSESFFTIFISIKSVLKVFN